MNHLNRYILSSLMVSCCSFAAATYDAAGGINQSGSIESNMLISQGDAETGAKKQDGLQMNSYVELMVQSSHVDAGIRMEYMENPLPGYENDFKGWGVPHFWITGRAGCGELTGGTFYEQFGSGFVLRTYEDRTLGIDNSLLGGRLVLRPTKGITLKALAGRQRRYWDWSKGFVSGVDAEVDMSEWVKALKKHGTELTLGGSWVNKYEKQEDIYADATHKYNLPEFVNAFDIRATMNSGPWTVLAEYAHKSQDPSFDNEYSYRSGTVLFLSCSYAENGLGLLLQGRRSQNMAFRSRRNMTGTSSYINHLPAFTQEHTYALASLYPYATQFVNGEWAWQAEAGYNFKRNTAFGGRYGMRAKLVFSHVRWEGKTYYQDIDAQITRNVSRDFKMTLMYMNQCYNKTVVEGHGGMVRSNIFIADGRYQLTPKTVLRTELQYLSTHDDVGDWINILLELSLASRWMFFIGDMYNVGETHIHYYQGGIVFSTAGHRLQAGYQRTRAGYNCAGGICRYVPATRGFTLSYNYSF